MILEFESLDFDFQNFEVFGVSGGGGGGMLVGTTGGARGGGRGADGWGSSSKLDSESFRPLFFLRTLWLLGA